jgi:hypothetical protein
MLYSHGSRSNPGFLAVHQEPTFPTESCATLSSSQHHPFAQ